MRPTGRLVAVLACLFAFVSATGWSQSTVTIHRPTGEIGIDFDGLWMGFPSSPGHAQRTFREWVDLELSGEILHPRLFNFTLGLRPVREQTSWTAEPDSPSGGGQRFNGKLLVNALSGAPLSLSASGLRLSQDNRGQFGVESDVRITE